MDKEITIQRLMYVAFTNMPYQSISHPHSLLKSLVVVDLARSSRLPTSLNFVTLQMLVGTQNKTRSGPYATPH
jgi:hypothetical protein